MLLWFTFVIMTAAALGALLWPVWRRGDPEPPSRDAELAVYRDQLAEVERDAARGLIEPEEALATRNEVSRRMLAAAGPDDATPASSTPASRRAALLVAMAAIPVVALSTYLALGRPDLARSSPPERVAARQEHSDFAAMVAQVEAHLADNPDDAQGWLVLAPTYRGMGRYADAAAALERALELVPETPELLTDFGEAMVMADDGQVKARAREAFEKALALEPGNAKGLFYRALAQRQDGQNEQALATWRGLLDGAPADAPWRGAVERQVASLERELSAAPQLSEDDIAKAGSLEGEDRQAMIRGMVDGLQQRLERDGQDLEGWLRLARARAVLGEPEAAIAALRSAEQNFSGDPESLGLIAETRTALGLAAGTSEPGP